MSDFELHNTFFPRDTPGKPELQGQPEGSREENKPVGADAQIRRLLQQSQDNPSSHPTETDASDSDRASDNQTTTEG